MKTEKISAVIFSPTNSTQGVVSHMSAGFLLPISTLDITPISSQTLKRSFSANELVIFAVPVYGGRVPAPAVERIKNMYGAQTPAVLVSVYGNRDYDDALLELKDLAEQNGFIPIAAAAFIAEHSIMHSVAPCRPDKEDRAAIADFASNVWDKLENSVDLQPISVKGNTPYREYGGVPFKPQSDQTCTRCGTCASNCPVGAINPKAPDQTNKDLCISCMRCIKVCPVHARKLNKIVLAVAEKGFAVKNSARKEPEIFI